MIFLVSREGEEWGYVCRSVNEESFVMCLHDIENSMQIGFVSASKMDDQSYELIEERLGREISWKANVTDKEFGFVESDDVLYLINIKELSREPKTAAA